MIYSFLLIFFFSTAHADTSILDSSVIGCPMVSQTHYVKINSRVDIQKSYLDKFSGDKKKQQEIRKEAIDFQLKYLVGAFKEFHTKEIFKATFSHFQGPSLIKKSEVNTEIYPELDLYWPKDRGENTPSYITHIIKEGKGPKAVESLQYEVLVHAFSCAKKKISSQQFVKALNELPFPKDPYIGFWVNNKNERSKELNQPDCFSYEFALFGVPEQTWFFWSPIQHAKEGQCKIGNTGLVQKDIFLEAQFPKTKELIENKIPTTLSGSIFFGKINVDENFFIVRSNDDFLKMVLANFDFCSKEKRPVCLGKWNEFFQVKDKKQIEPGAGSYINFLKYLSTVVDIKSYRLKEKGADFFTLELKVENSKTLRSAKIDIYYGPTSLYNPLLASKRYWESLGTSFYQDDFLFYTGHAGLGANLALDTIKHYSAMKTPKVLRQKPLYLGIFNCEALSYFGFDYEELFKNKTDNNLLYLLSSSGVETNSLFSLSYLDFLLSNETFNKKNFEYALHDYVQSQDFLGYQKINYKKE